MIYLLQNGQLWLGLPGQEHSLMEVQQHFSKYSTADLGKLRSQGMELLATHASAKNDYADHYMVKSYGSVAVVSVQGSLLNHSLPLRAFGLPVTTYGEIYDTVASLYADANIDTIVMAYDTPGGTQNGLGRLSNFLQKVGKEKKMLTYTDSQMASAGMWLGANARSIVIDPMAEVGSVGVYILAVSRAKEIENAGYEVKVVRAGEFKALGHPAEPITEKLTDHLQAKVDKTYDMFLEHMSTARGQNKESFRKKAAEGRVFMGDDARKAGLVDKVMLFDDFMAELLQSKGKVNKSSSASGNQGKLSAEETQMNLAELLKKAGIELTDQQAAALGSGVQLQDLGLTAEQIATVEKLQAEADAAEEEETEEEQKTSDAETDAPTPVVTPPPVAANLTDVTALLGLQDKLTKSEIKVSALLQETDTLKKQIKDITDLSALLKTALVERVQMMASAMRKSYPTLQTSSPTELLSSYAELKAEFEATFPAGRKTSGSDIEIKNQPGRKVPAPRMTKAAVEATKF